MITMGWHLCGISTFVKTHLTTVFIVRYGRSCDPVMMSLYIQSPVVSTTFAKFHPSYLIGGTLSGQVGVSQQFEL